MRRHAWLLVLLAVLAAGKTTESPANARGAFHMRIRSKFLEPGTPAGSRPLYLTPLVAQDDGTFAARATAWYVPVRVSVSRDLKTLRTYAPMHDPRLPEWDLWRHRHGYTLGMGREYAWNTLGDRRLNIPRQTGEFYDAYLIALYRLWTRRALKERLASKIDAPSPPEPAGETTVALTMQYDETGLAEPVGGSFRLHAWHLPVEVGFTLLPSSATRASEWWFRVRGDAFLNYDRDAWRARHAYRKTLFGYAWDPDFPGGEALGTADGKRLDALMERGLAYWADAALQMGLFELDQELKAASRRFRRKRYASAARSPSE